MNIPPEEDITAKDLLDFVLGTQSLLLSEDKTTGHAPDFVMEESNAVAQVCIASQDTTNA